MSKDITNYYGQIIARLDEESNGDIVVKDFYGKILGYYRKSQKALTDFYGKIIAKGGSECIGILFADKFKK